MEEEDEEEGPDVFCAFLDAVEEEIDTFPFWCGPFIPFMVESSLLLYSSSSVSFKGGGNDSSAAHLYTARITARPFEVDAAICWCFCADVSLSLPGMVYMTEEEGPNVTAEVVLPGTDAPITICGFEDGALATTPRKVECVFGFPVEVPLTLLEFPPALNRCCCIGLTIDVIVDAFLPNSAPAVLVVVAEESRGKRYFEKKLTLLEEKDPSL